MKPKSRGLDVLGPEPALAPRVSEQVEQSIAAAEDLRAEGAVVCDGASLADALRRSQAELRRRDVEITSLSGASAK